MLCVTLYQPALSRQVQATPRAVPELAVVVLLSLRVARRFVSFSWLHLFALPTLALSVGSLAAQLATNLADVLQSDWCSASVKIAVFSVLYTGILFASEKENVTTLLEEN